MNGCGVRVKIYSYRRNLIKLRGGNNSSILEKAQGKPTSKNPKGKEKKFYTDRIHIRELSKSIISAELPLLMQIEEKSSAEMDVLPQPQMSYNRF